MREITEEESSSEKQTDSEIENVYGIDELTQKNGAKVIYNKTFKCCLPFCSKSITNNCKAAIFLTINSHVLF